MSKRDPSLFLDDMLEALGRIEEYTEGFSQEEFVRDQKTTDAVIRNLEILGEACGQIPLSARALEKESVLSGWRENRESGRFHESLSRCLLPVPAVRRPNIIPYQDGSRSRDLNPQSMRNGLGIGWE